MPVEMVGRDIEQNADGRIERRRKIDLEGRTLDDMDAVRDPAASSARMGVPILPPTSTSKPKLAEKMRDERGRRRFAIGAGDRDEGRAGRDLAALAAEELDVADDLDARLAAP